MVKRTIKTTYQINSQDYQDYLRYTKDYQSDKNYLYSRFSGIHSLQILDFRTIRNLIQKEKPSNLKVSGHYGQRLLNDVVGNIKSSWSKTFNSVKYYIQNSTLTPIEKHFLNVVLSSPKVVYDFITGQDFKYITQIKYFNKWKQQGGNIQSFTTRTYEQLQNWLNRTLRACKPKISHTSVDNKLKADRTLYRQDGSLIYLQQSPYSQRGSRKRISLSTTHNQPFRSEVDLIFENQQVTVHHIHDVKLKAKPRQKNIIALDKGLTDLLTADDGSVYGKGYGQFIQDDVLKARDKMKKRHYFHQLARKAEENGDKVKAERIRLNNLGRQKQKAKASKLKDKKKSFINHSLNQLFTKQPSQIITEDLTWKGRKAKVNKTKQYELSTWDKGYLQERLDFKAYIYQVPVKLVNPAYTSQLCSHCGQFGQRETNKKWFSCNHCHTRMDADVNAAKNIKERIKDKEITVLMKARQVKSILDARLGQS